MRVPRVEGDLVDLQGSDPGVVSWSGHYVGTEVGQRMRCDGMRGEGVADVRA